MVGVVVHAVAAIIGAGAIAIAVSTSMQGTLSSGRRIRVVANDCWPLTPELMAAHWTTTAVAPAAASRAIKRGVQSKLVTPEAGEGRQKRA